MVEVRLVVFVVQVDSSHSQSSNHSHFSWESRGVADTTMRAATETIEPSMLE